MTNATGQVWQDYPPPTGVLRLSDVFDPIPVTRFSTESLAPQDRHEAWANRDWPAIGPIFDSTPQGHFHNRSDRFALGAVTVHFADMAAQCYDRQAGRARRDGVDGLMAELLLAGETIGDAAGTPTSNSAGGMVFNDLAQAHRHRSSATRTLLLSIPRAVAERAGIDVRALHGRRVSPAATALLRAHLLATHAALPLFDAAIGERLGQTAIDLLSVALDIDGLRAPASTREARDVALKLAARRMIDANLASPLLSVGWLCTRLGVPRSRLYRLFEADGGVSAYVRERRLERVRGLLATPDLASSVGDLAHLWGFSDASHLGRLFRERFGVSPGDYRAVYTAGLKAKDLRRSDS